MYGISVFFSVTDRSFTPFLPSIGYSYRHDISGDKNPLGKLYAAGLVLVDAESQARVKRFYHKKDSYRCLLGRLLPRLLLKQHGVSPKEAAFGRTTSGKPFVTAYVGVLTAPHVLASPFSSTPHLEQTIGFNVSHDNEYVVMAFQKRNSQSQTGDAPQTKEKSVDVTTIGVDVMKVGLPRYEKTLTSFVSTISDTLTPSERRSLLEGADNSDGDEHTRGLRYLYLIWTLKEAYTKAIGLGLSFDFKRIEVNVHASQITVDGVQPDGWEFTAFTLKSRPGDEYQVAVARFTGDVNVAGHVDVKGLVDAKTFSWFSQYDAVSMIERIAGGE
ncbi:hypothetical protein EW145_g592 [Phellinidium pouzarii]|uniref:holo-[acyl-carrier-protein] synthase n=1 Tax=Phellinidium pouzarii TaxID=167371 RepID=A0A4S4LJK7_9AGAM|nr:hypothetical protein EW145_g592 [Phellinidium pouzarii]